jgi:glycine hydroxymethyltransferase
LYDWHSKLADKSHIGSFAGYLMPLWYSSISSEHISVREAAGIFDCTHMGVFEISGAGAAEFLDQLTTNSIANLEIRYAYYSFVLEPSGNVLDDVIVYRRGLEEFMLVANAANDAKIKNWIKSLVDDEVCIDPEQTGRKICSRPKVRDLRGADCGEDCRVDIALQGPKSLDVLSALTEGNEVEWQIADLRPFQFVETNIRGIECLVSRSGYTGASVGFELFVHPEKASQLWEMVLDAGRAWGLLPCGLGSRDSLRIEAGLPLHGHELAGQLSISPFEAGYGWAVKLDKEFFIGKAAMERISREYDMKVARVELPGTRGIRPVRQNDGVLGEHRRSVGWVLSSAVIAEKQIALVYVDREYVEESDSVGVYYSARSDRQIRQGRRQSIEKGERLEPDLTGRVVSRFAKF